MTPHLDRRQSEQLNALADALLSLRDRAECLAFLQDLCTVQELTGLAQRLQVARLLLEGATYESIRQQLPVSSSTITRINTALQFGSGGYRSVLERPAGGPRETD